MKKILIVYYSRTGTTQKIAERLKDILGADLETIGCQSYPKSVKGYLLAGRDATMRKLATIDPAKFNPTDYDLTIIGTPIWSWNMSSPIRTYLNEQKNNFKLVAFFCTMDGSGAERAFREMAEIIGQKVLAALALKTVEVVKNNFEEKLKIFCSQLTQN
jgi:flavodoxin